MTDPRTHTVLLQSDDGRWRVFSYATSPEDGEREAARGGVGFTGRRPHRVVPGYLPFTHDEYEDP